MFHIILHTSPLSFVLVLKRAQLQKKKKKKVLESGKKRNCFDSGFIQFPFVVCCRSLSYHYHITIILYANGQAICFLAGNFFFFTEQVV